MAKTSPSLWNVDARRPLRPQPPQVVEQHGDFLLGERGGGLVKHEHAGLFVHRADDFDELLLADAEGTGRRLGRDREAKSASNAAAGDASRASRRASRAVAHGREKCFPPRSVRREAQTSCVITAYGRRFFGHRDVLEGDPAWSRRRAARLLVAMPCGGCPESSLMRRGLHATVRRRGQQAMTVYKPLKNLATLAPRPVDVAKGNPHHASKLDNGAKAGAVDLKKSISRRPQRTC